MVGGKRGRPVGYSQTKRRIICNDHIWGDWIIRGTVIIKPCVFCKAVLDQAEYFRERRVKRKNYEILARKVSHIDLFGVQ